MGIDWTKTIAATWQARQETLKAAAFRSFSLSLSFYPIMQDAYFAIVDMLFRDVNIND